MSVWITDQVEQSAAVKPLAQLTEKQSDRRAYCIVKRGFDLVASILGLLILLIPMAVIGLIVMLDSPGAALFRQERLGKDGRPFMMYKFRSMRPDAEDDGPRWAEEEDPRCTRFGRFLRRTKIDELPQLYNILRGEMSFVGPRPEREYFYHKFETYVPHFRQRLRVRPGLTGLAQINGGYDLKPEEKIVYDMEYIQNQSIRMDLKCILRTFVVLFTQPGTR